MDSTKDSSYGEDNERGEGHATASLLDSGRIFRAVDFWVLSLFWTVEEEKKDAGVGVVWN